MNPEPIRYLVGSKEGTIYSKLQVSHAPLGVYNDEPTVIVQIGEGPVAEGCVLPPKKILDFSPHIFRDKAIDGKLKMVGMEQEAPGWFARKCEEAGCSWFVPFVERMASGETVSLEEIQTAYRANNGGKEMISGVYGKPFKL